MNNTPSEWSRGRLVTTVPTALTLCMLLGAACLSAWGRDPFPTTGERPDFELVGAISGGGGQPLVGARVILIAPAFAAGDRNWFENMVPLAMVEGATDTAGTFRLRFPRNDTRFLAFGDFSLMVVHADHQMIFERFPLARLQVDVPWELSLQESTSVLVRLVDAEGLPLSFVKVAVAEQGAVTIPHAVMAEFASVTDAQGWVTLQNADPARLQSIYAEGSEIGLQKLSLSATGGHEFQAQALRSISLSGTIRREGGQPVSGMDQLEMVVSSRPRSDVWDKPRDYSWARVSVDANGGFSIRAISEGTVEFLVRYPPEFSYRPSRNFTVQSRHISAADPRTLWTIPLDHAVRVRGKILSQQSGSPVAHVLIWNHYSSDMINRFSDEEGNWSLWLARGTACELQVIPTLGDVALTSDNDTLVTVDAESGEQQVEPFYVRGSTTTRGMVRDQQGAALAGSVIVCERRSGDVWWKHTLYSGSDGSFPLLGVADGDTIRLSARCGDLATPSPVTFTVSSSDHPELVLVPQTAVQFTGTVIDANGDPVQGAIVRLKKRTIVRPEGYSPEVARTEDLLPRGSFVRTDVLGRYSFPPTIDGSQRIRLQVVRHGFRGCCTPWLDGSKLPVSDGRIQLDDCRLLRLPEAVETVVSVVDAASGQGVAGAKVVVLGAWTGHVSGTTDEHGSLTRPIRNGPQVIAVDKEGFAPVFQLVDAIDGQLRVELRRRVPADNAVGDATARFTVAQLQDVGRAILELAPVPREDTSPVYRLHLYFPSLATVAPHAAVEVLSAPDAGMPLQDSLVSLCWGYIMQVDRDYAAQLVRLETDQKAISWRFRTLAFEESDPVVRNDYVAEALIAARQLGDSDYLMAMAATAMVVWEGGDAAGAKNIIREAWDKSSQLQAMVTDNKRQQMVGVSRYFARTMALIDPDISMRLITLSALPEEINRLRTEALILVADSAPEKFHQMMAEIGYDQLEPRRFMQFVVDYGVRRVPLVAAIARRMPDSMEKARTLVQLARRARQLGDPCAVDLCGEALSMLYRIDGSRATENALSHNGGRAAELVGDVYQAAPELVPDFLFASMWLWSGSHGDGNGLELLSAIASAMARFDPTVARQLVEPCCDEFSWLYDESQPTLAYHRCGLLAAATRIDPNWAAQIVQRIATTGLAADDMRRLELVCGVIDQLRAMIVDVQRMNSKQ